MKRSSLTADSLTNRISYYHLLFLMASLPFDRFFSHIILISFALHLLIHFNRAAVKPVFTLQNIILQAVFFVTAISTLYTTEKDLAYSELGRQVPILVFPVLFCLMPLDLQKYRPKLLLAYAWVCAATIVYLYIDAFFLIGHYGLSYSAIFSPSFTNHNFSAPIDMHATFLSMQLAIALVYMVSALMKNQASRFSYVLCICILLVGLIQLCSKSVFFPLLLIVNIAIPYFLLEGKRRLMFLAIAASATVLIGATIMAIPTLRMRYVTDLRTDLSPSTTDELLDPRLARWGEVVKLIKEAPIIGHGAGTEVTMLHESFFSKKYYSSFLKNLNAHNQYLSFLFKSGLWGLLVYLGVLIYGFRCAIKNHDLLFFTFMLIIALVSVSENILDVDKGVFFYAFFLTFFMFSANNNNVIARNEAIST